MAQTTPTPAVLFICISSIQVIFLKKKDIYIYIYSAQLTQTILSSKASLDLHSKLQE